MAWASGWPELSPGLAGSSSASALRPDSRASSAFWRPCLFFQPQRSHEVRHALAEPGAGRRHPRVREGVGHYSVELFGRGRLNDGDEQRAGFKGRVLGVGKIENGELRARRLAQPALQKGRDCRSCGGPARHGCIVIGQRPERGVRGVVLGANGDKEAGSFKAEGRAVESWPWPRRGFLRFRSAAP